ncbi:MAG: M6 family metalloprotease domain-containing protein [bacterium]
MHRFVSPRNPERERPTGRIVLAAVLALLALALGGALDTSRAATSCVVLPRDGKLPPHAAEAREQFASYVPANPGGWEVIAERARQNRKDLAEGRITAREADDRGGLAVGGTLSIPVLATLYNDTPSAPPFASVAALQTQLFGSNPTGSMTDYYEEVSYGNLNLTGTVFGWRRAALPMGAYTIPNNGLGGGGKDFVREAVARHDATVNFANFDNDGDGYVDIVVVVHPTMGAECAGPDVNMWSHHHYLTANGGLPAITADGVFVDRYFVAPALSCVSGLIEIGVFCHEMGHALGIKDLYDTEDGILYQGSSAGIGDWGLMGSGGGNPDKPSHMEAFSKERLGWLTYLNIASDVTHLCLPPVETNPVAARVWSQGSIGPEYFLVENRQTIGFDVSLPAPGLVIYHVDEDVYDEFANANRVNAFETHKAIDVECADADAAGHVLDADSLDANTSRGDAGDVWCNSGAGAWSFNANTTPDTRAYSGAATGVAIENIGNCTNDPTTQPGWVCADYIVGVANPADMCIDDCPSDNCNPIATCGEYWASPNIWINNDDDFENEIPAPGIDNKVWVRFKNLGPTALANAQVRIYAAQGTAGLEWPADADTLLGFAGANIINPGQTVEDQLVFEYPELFDYEGHYCIGVVLQETVSPGSTQANLSNNIAQVNSQVLFARAGGAAKSMACPGAFSKSTRIYLRDGYNPTQDVRKAIVRVGSPPGFNDAVIPPGWTLSILPSMGPFFLSPGMRDSITVRLNSANAAHGQTAHVPITLWDTDQNVTIGGVTIDVTIDCNDPRAPRNGSAEWTNPPGDDIGGPTVRVQWDPVLYDVEGGQETIQYYEVFRRLDDALPYASVAEVAIDAETLMPGFQWYDDIPRDHCPAQATYIVRAIDGADGFGSFSDPILVPCATTRVDGPAIAPPAGGFTSAAPNPFQSSTAIAFNLPRAGDLELEIFNAQGERVRTLARGHQPAGDHRFEWDGLDDGRRPVASGIYFYGIVAPGVSETRKIVLAR